MRLTKAEITAGFCALCLAACNPVETVSKAYSLWANEPTAQEAYPDLNPQQAQLRYANDEMRYLLSALPTPAERQLAAAQYALANARDNAQSDVICRDMKENPDRYLIAQTFSAHFPYAMAVMETPVQTAQNGF